MRKLLARVQSRLSFLFWFEKALAILTVAAAALLLHLLFHKWLYLPWSTVYTFTAVLFATGLWSWLWYRGRRPDLRCAAAQLDYRFATKDRFRSALFFDRAAADSDYGRYLVAGVEALSRDLPWRQQFPLRPPRYWWLPVILLLAGGAIYRYVPEPPAPLRMTPEETALAAAATEMLEDTRDELERLADEDENEELSDLVEELAAAAARLEANLDSKDEVLAELDRLAQELQQYEQQARATAEQRQLDLADGLADAGYEDAAQSLRRGDWEGGMQGLADRIERAGLDNAAAAEELAQALEAAAAQAGGQLADQMRQAAQAVRNGDASGVAEALREAAGQDLADPAATQQLRQLANQLSDARQRIIASGMDGLMAQENQGMQRGGDNSQAAGDGTNGAPGSGQNPGQGPGQGQGAGPQQIEGDASGIGLGSTNQQQFGSEAQTGPGRTREEAPSRYEAYEQIYGSELLEGDGRNTLAPGQHQGGPLLEEVTSVSVPPQFGEGGDQVSPESVRVYRAAAGAAMEYEEIPEAHREYVKEYFEEVIGN